MSSTQQPDQEPSIEEILASIRRIISEDGEKPAEAVPAEPPPAPVFAPPPPPPPPPPAFAAPEPEEEVLELTTLADEEPAAVDPVATLDPPPAPPAPAPAPSIAPQDGLLSAAAATAAASALARVATARPADGMGRMPVSATTLDQLVKDLLRPMLKEWLDAHLPPLVERLVQRELEKLTRHAEEDR